MINLIERLQNWYISRCDEIWEHSHGVKISTLDNPGWRLVFNGVSGREALNISIDRDDDDIDWVRVTSTENSFDACGGAGNLCELLNIAIEWLEAEGSGHGD